MTAWASRTQLARRLAAPLVVAIVAAACGPRPDGAGGEPGLADFVEGARVSGRVVENSTACTVDAECYLRIEFADTTVVAMYGTGERPAPPCAIPAAVSDVAFQVEVGDQVDVVVSRCGSQGYYLERIGR